MGDVFRWYFTPPKGGARFEFTAGFLPTMSNWTVSGRPMAQGGSIAVADLGNHYPFAALGIVELEVNGTRKLWGRAQAATMEDIDQTPVELGGVWRLPFEDIYGELKRLFIPTDQTPEVSQPANLTRLYDDSPALLTYSRSGKDAFIKAWSQIAAIEAKKLAADPTYVGLPVPIVVDPDLITGMGFMLNKYFAYMGNGQSYYSMPDDFVVISFATWLLRDFGTHFSPVTWGALDVPLHPIEITDLPGVDPEQPGADLVFGFDMKFSEDTAGERVVNTLECTYYPKPGHPVTFMVYANDPDLFPGDTSNDDYGDFMDRMPTQFRTPEMTKAAAKRRMAYSRHPQRIGSVTVRYRSDIAAGYNYWIHRKVHGGPTLSFLAYARGLTYGWELTEEGLSEGGEPTWITIDFSPDIYEPINFNPHVAKSRDDFGGKTSFGGGGGHDFNGAGTFDPFSDECCADVPPLGESEIVGWIQEAVA